MPEDTNVEIQNTVKQNAMSKCVEVPKNTFAEIQSAGKHNAVKRTEQCVMSEDTTREN